MKLRRVISVSGSVLLALLLIAFAIGLFGYSYLNQQLKSIGISDWHIEFERLTPSHIVINRLEVTIDPLPQQPTETSPATLNLTQILSVEMPALLPERIDVKSLHLEGSLLSENVSATLKLLNQEQLWLQVESHQPVVAALEMIRSDASVELKARYNSAVLHADYDYRSGQFKADASYLFAAQQFAGKVKTEQLPVNAQWRGNLSPNIGQASFENFVSKLSGKLLLSIKEDTEIEVMDSSTTASGQLQLNLNDGVINFYQLELDGDTENIMSLTGSELPVQLTSMSWHMNSSDQLSLRLLDVQQAVNKTHWPVSINAVAKGKKNETISISSELSVQQNQWQFSSLEFDHLQFQANTLELLIADQPLMINKLTSRFSGRLSTKAAEFQSIEPTHIELNILNNDASAVVSFSNAYYPYSEPHNAFAEFSLNVHADTINFDPLRNLKADFDSEFRYQQQQLTGDGELLLGEHIRMQHHSQISSSQLKSRVELANFNWQQTPQLSTLLKHIAPQFVISKATISGQTNVSFFWNDGLWQLDNGLVEIQQSDWVADTLSVVDSNLNFGFSANNEQLDVDNAQLHITSLQQGFTLGPVTAEFGLHLPFQNPQQSALNLTSHTIKALGGSISVPNQSYSLASNFALPVVFEKISLGELMRQYPSNKISIDGDVSGTIPVYWDSKQFTVERGYMDALAPGGHLQVDSSALVSVAGNNPSLRTLAGVLSNFYYQQLSATIDYDQNDKLTLAIRLKGSNPQVENGRPIELNVNLEEDLPALLKGLTLTNSLNEVIRKRVQQKIN